MRKKISLLFSIFGLLMCIMSTNVFAADEYQSGMYKVGIDIPSGEYVLFAENGTGYFCVSSDSNGDDIITNENFEYNSIITVNNGEYFEMKRSYAKPIADVRNHELKITGTGMFKVGVHIPAGEYRLICDSSEKGYYCIYNSSRQQKIISNNNFENSQYVTVSDGQYLLLKRCSIENVPQQKMSDSSKDSLNAVPNKDNVINQGTITVTKENLQPVLGNENGRCVYVKKCKYTQDKSDICILLNEDDYSDGMIRVDILNVSIDGKDIEFKNNSFGTPTNGTRIAKFYVKLEDLQKLDLTDFEKMTCNITVSMDNSDSANTVCNTELVIMREAFDDYDAK